MDWGDSGALEYYKNQKCIQNHFWSNPKNRQYDLLGWRNNMDYPC